MELEVLLLIHYELSENPTEKNSVILVGLEGESDPPHTLEQQSGAQPGGQSWNVMQTNLEKK